MAQRPPPPSSASARRAKEGRPLAGRRVLIVDDELFVALALESHLEALGLEIVGLAANGEDAIGLARDHKPEIVVLDINLGEGIDGIEAARRMRAEGPLAIVFVSAYGEDEIRDRIRQAAPGAPLLDKPVLAAELETAVREAIETRH